MAGKTKVGISLHVPPDQLTPSQRGTATHHLLELSLTAKCSPLDFLGKVVVADWGEGETHARLSPSGSSRWLVCPGVIDRSAALPQETRPKVTTNVDEHMVAGAEIACDYLRPIVARSIAHGFETKVFIPATQETGTADAWALLEEHAHFPQQFLHLYVTDYKNGRHAVVVKDNTQLMLYVQGVLARTLPLHRGKQVKITIVIIQPNALAAERIETWVTSKAAIVDWCQNKVKPIVTMINSGKAPLIAGDHCKNCKVAVVGDDVCPKLAAQAARITKMDWSADVKPNRNSTVAIPKSAASLVTIIKALPLLRAFADAAEKEAMKLLIKNPNGLPGLKVVEGKANRQWTDPQMVLTAFYNLGLKPDQYAPRKLVGIGDGERLVPKPKREQFMTKFTKRPNGRPVLAASSDPRPTINSDAKVDFADDIEE